MRRARKEYLLALWKQAQKEHWTYSQYCKAEWELGNKSLPADHQEEHRMIERAKDEQIKELRGACYLARQALFRPDHPQAQERRLDAYEACKKALENTEEQE